MFIFLSPFSLSKIIPYKPNCEILYQEAFNLIDTQKYWFPTEAQNYTNDWLVQETQIPQTMKDETALYCVKGNSYSAVSRKFPAPIDITAQTFVLQYEFRAEFAFTCSGAYIKLFGDNFDPLTLTNETDYLLMFGPDRCGTNKKVHFIVNHKDPKTQKITQIQAEDPPKPYEDQLTHLYTLVLKTDNSYFIFIDNELKKAGTLPMRPNVPKAYGIGFELWHVNKDLSFNNILIATDEEAVFEWNKQNFLQRQAYQRNELQEGLTYDTKQKIISRIMFEISEAVQLLRTRDIIFIALAFLLPLLINVFGCFLK